MTPEEQAIVKDRLRELAEILYRNTASEALKTFETIELSVREHIFSKKLNFKARLPDFF